MFAVQRGETFLNRSARQLLVRPVDPLHPLDPLVTAGIRLDHARIHGKALALGEPGCHASAHNALEHKAQEIALTKPTVPVDRESRMVRNRGLKPEAAKPSIRKVKLDLLA